MMLNLKNAFGLLLMVSSTAYCSEDNKTSDRMSNESNRKLVKPSKFTIGGSVTGLVGKGLVIRNNNVDELVITVGGIFEFDTAIADSTKYKVTVLRQPAGVTCEIKNASGTLLGHDITNIKVMCRANKMYSEQ